ncbi:MAG TPA: hypothetical protein VF992_04880 [Thermoplasmata archaeon]
MADRAQHLAQYADFKKGADLEVNPPQLRVEAIFLAMFHLIDACAALRNVHINKHQRVRYELERNRAIFGNRTEEVWLSFQDLETRLRPKFVYGKRWRPDDFKAAFEKAARIEEICREVLR